MTKLLFILDENTLAALDIPHPVGELAEALRRGEVLPETGEWHPPRPGGWRVLQLGDLVIVDLEPGTAALPQPSAPPTPRLSLRQRQVLDLLRQGLTTRQIAAHLKISTRTVHFHVTAIKTTLGALTRAQTIWLAGEDHGKN